MTPRLIPTAAVALIAWLAGADSGSAADEFTSHHENVMGTSLELVVRADEPQAAAWAEGRVLGEVDRLSRVFSNHDPSSEFRRWQDVPAGPVKVSPELFEVLGLSDRWRVASSGAFDPRVDALTRVWTASAAEGRTPTLAERTAAAAVAAKPAWRLNPAAGTAERLPGGPLTLDAIAKGYVVEKACAAALDPSRGVRGILLNVGGDLRVCGDAPRVVGVAPPRGDSETAGPVTMVDVRDRAVATSGDSRRGLRIGGRWYSHVFDPRTGLPASGVASATVVAVRSADADALATALNVLTSDEGVRLVDTLPDAACLIVTPDGRAFRSAAWARYERPRPSPTPILASATLPGQTPGKGPGSWADAYELRVDFEINRPQAEAGRYRRPFIAVWVERPDGFPVRNLILWVSQGGSGPFQWIPDLKRWYLADRRRKKVDKTEMVLTMSRPTRPPGKYSVVWDGKDDQGNPLPAGAYVVCIDAAREHGTSQSIRFPVTLGDRPFVETDRGNVEIKSASVTYRRKVSP